MAEQGSERVGNPGRLPEVSELRSLRFRLIGPAWGGRVSHASGVPGDYRTLYAATAGGGVWKSNDGGSTWKSIFDDQSVSSIGSLAVASSDPNVIYVGSGEANIRGNVAAGNGIYKSIDGGTTWSHVWEAEGQIGNVAIHPTNPDIAFAAVLGHAFGQCGERGIYRTMDGGKTWNRVLHRDENTGASDVAIDPSNPNVVFAGLWQAQRLPWSLQSGGPGSGLYVSHDGGNTWMNLKDDAPHRGLPAGMWGKVGISIALSDSRRIYALIEAEDGGLYRSDDQGETWKHANASHLLRQRAFYYSTLSVNPRNANEVWFPQVSLLKSTDGGASLVFVNGTHHGDFHDVWFDPKTPGHIIASTDGGVEISVNGGESWQAPRLPICQVYHIATDNRMPFYIAGTIQDMGSAQGPSDTLATGGIDNSDWYPVGGGEAGHIVSDPADPNIVYAGQFGPHISRYDHRTKQAHNVSVLPQDMEGHDAEGMKYRFQMTSPIAVSSHRPGTIYHAANVLFRSRDHGQSWKAISGDLTRDDKNKQKWSGGPITGDNTGAEVYDTIFALAESPINENLIWVGTDDGLVQLTRNGGRTWKNVTPAMPGIPEWGTVSMIEASHFSEGAAYVAVDAHRMDNQKPYLFKTRDFGASWQRLDGGLPQEVYLHAVREDVKRQGLLYLGTERGIAFSTNDGTTWNSLRLNLPTVAVHDLIVKGNSLVVATMGRSIWSFDHLTALRQLSPTITSDSARLFGTTDVIRWNIAYRPGESAGDSWSGENPHRGAVMYYSLKDSPKEGLTVEIFAANHELVRHLSSIPREAPLHNDYGEQIKNFLTKSGLSVHPGINELVWDLTEDPPEMIQGAKLEAGTSILRGPRALPGMYTVRLGIGTHTATTTLSVLPDPRVRWSEKESRAAHELTVEIRNEISRLTNLVRRIQVIRSELKSRNQLLKDDAEAAVLVRDSTDLIRKLDELESEIHNPTAQVSLDILAMKGGARPYSQLVSLFEWSKDSDDTPAQGMREEYLSEKKKLDRFQEQLQYLIDGRLKPLNDESTKLGHKAVLLGSPITKKPGPSIHHATSIPK